MKYPTMEQVDVADRTQVCRWYRFLPSPGASAVGRDDFNRVIDAESIIGMRIAERLMELGGFTPEISKAIGWHV